MTYQSDILKIRTEKTISNPRFGFPALLIGLMLCIHTTVNAQILLGASIEDVNKSVKERCTEVRSGFTEESGRYYIIGSEPGLVTVYYFNEQNICDTYHALLPIRKKEIIKGMKTQGWTVKNDALFKGDYIATVHYSKDVKINYIEVTYK